MMGRKRGIFSVDELLADWRLPQKSSHNAVGSQLQKRKYGETAPLTGPCLINYAHKMVELEKFFISVLPQEMRQEFQLARYDEGRLVVFCTNVGYASYLKYHSAEIMSELRKQFPFQELLSIKVYREI